MRPWEVAFKSSSSPGKKTRSLRRLCSRELGTENAEALITHVLERMGGFIIDGWRLRTRV